MFVQVRQRGFVQGVVQANHESAFQPAAGVEIAVELGDFLHRVFGRMHQAHQAHVGRQDIVILQQLFLHELQGVFPVAAARLVEQHDRHQRTLAGLYQGQHFQCLV